MGASLIRPLATFAAIASWMAAVVWAGASDHPSGGLDATRNQAGVEAGPAFHSRPFTIECVARMNRFDAYNIILACEPKSSPHHWELYTHAQSGHLAFYVPGNGVKDVRSSRRLDDGQWHRLAVVMDGRDIRLYCDGKEVAAAPDTRPQVDGGHRGSMVVGALCEGGLGCNGTIGEVRLSRAAREIAADPPFRLEVDDATLALWRFGEPAVAGVWADAAGGDHPATLRPAPGIGRPGGGGANRSGERARDLVRPVGGQVGIIPPASDVAGLRRSLAEALGKLSLETCGEAECRDGLLVDWDEQGWHLANQVAGREQHPPQADAQVVDRHSLVMPSDGDALGAVLRRTEALLNHLREISPGLELAAERRDLARLREAAAAIPASDAAARKGLCLAAFALNRQVAFANPLLDFDRILFVARGVYQGSRLGGARGTADAWGQHFQTQYFGFNSIPGGGLFEARDFRTRPRIVNLTEGAVVGEGEHRGRKLAGGAFMSPDLSFDGRTVLFAWTEGGGRPYQWTPESTWKIFRIGEDGSDLRQLTDGPWDDFDPCWLPDGRIAFISERRGGFIRCFGGLPVPQHTLHGMNPDGSDIRRLSFFETGEWHPSVTNDGRLAYTRWDYVDRENCLGSNIWFCGPDGRDPRAPHGNYPYPWHTFPDNTRGDSRIGRPYTEMNIRAIPGSPKFVLTAAPHHGESFGSLCLLDLSGPDDGAMSQLRRLTPYAPFPESESPGRQQYPYGTAWPLSEDFFLCNRWENIYLLDRFGNHTLLVENSLVFGGDTDWDMRLIDPIPLRPRPAPPQRPPGATSGDDPAAAPEPARITVVNVHASDLPFPPGVRIKHLRVLQVVPKSNPEMNSPKDMGYHWENTPRIPLGVVPIHEDGSAHFLAPVERQLLFQALDENYMAVQTMRSATYAHRGEHLTCYGCHESPHQGPLVSKPPLALQHPPARLEPEVGPVEPITFYRLVKPVFEKSCIPCHRERRAEPLDMGFEALREYVFYFAGGMRGSVMTPNHGGSRSIPGRVGARNSRLGRALLDETHRGKVAPEDFRRIVLWLDANAMRLGAFHSEDRQVAGEVVWPLLDCDPANPQGLEDGR